MTLKIMCGTVDKAQILLNITLGCKEFNTSLIERFNGTMRERLAYLTRKCRHASHRLDTLETGMYLIACTYNFCFPVRTVLPKRTSVRGWKVQGEYLDN